MPQNGSMARNIPFIKINDFDSLNNFFKKSTGLNKDKWSSLGGVSKTFKLSDGQIQVTGLVL